MRKCRKGGYRKESCANRWLAGGLAAGIGIIGMLAYPMTASSYPDVRFDRLGMEDGLSQSSIQGIAQDRDGYLWFGTQYGLNRYDGYQFEVFRHDPSDPDSISNDTIQGLHVASEGSLWILTRNGIDRMETSTGRVERVSANHGIQGGGSVLRTTTPVLEDGIGNILFPLAAGAALWQPDNERLNTLMPRPEVERRQLRPTAVALDPSGGFWLATEVGLWQVDAERLQMRLMIPARTDGERPHRTGLVMTGNGMLAFGDVAGLRLIDPASGEVVRSIDPREWGFDESRIDALAACDRGVLWLLLPRALVRLPEPSRGAERVLDLPEHVHQASRARRQLQVISDGNGFQWFSGEFGVGLHDPESSSTRLFRHDTRDQSSLAPTTTNTGYRLFVDTHGTVWVGSGLGGLSRFAPQSSRFQHVHESPGSKQEQAENIVRAVVEHRINGQERLWTGLDGKGLRVWNRGNDGRYELVRRFHPTDDKSPRLPDYRIRRLAVDPVDQHIWIASISALFSIDPVTGDVIEVIENTEFGVGGAINVVQLSEDRDRLMIGIGSCLFDRYRTGAGGWSRPRLQYCRGPDERSSNNSHEILEIMETADGGLALSGQSGISFLPVGDGPSRQIYPAGIDGRTAGNYVFGLAEYPAGVFWLGTRNAGLARLTFTKDEPQFEWFTPHEGLADLTVYAIAVDADGRLWLSGNRGLTRFDPELAGTRHFSIADGLQSLEFNHTVVHFGPSGRIYFGGINGVNVFRPESIVDHPDPPLIHLQDVRVNGRSVSTNNPLVLDHDENYLVIDYVGLHYADPMRNQYHYRLIGLEAEWVDAGGRRQARYPGLRPGTYAFELRAANSDGIWSEDLVLAEFRILPPPWRSAGALVLYALSAILLLTMLILWNQRRKRVLESLVRHRTRQLAKKNELVAGQAQKLEEALEARTTMFGNISHEFRTPLALVRAALDRLEREHGEEQAIRLARRYLGRLMRLVDQVLDLSRLRMHGAAESDPWSLSEVTAMTAHAFDSLASQHGITLNVDVESGWSTRCHQAQIEKILLNLISNAIKFTPAGGEISVALGACDGGAELSISDTGPGIPLGQQELIFERFHRLPVHEEDLTEGTGIGLALVREATSAIGGELLLDSEPGNGSSFRIRLPAGNETPKPSRAGLLSDAQIALETELLALADDEDRPASGELPTRNSRHPGLGTVLLVEDNVDLRRYISELLSVEWRVVESGDGREALARVLDTEVDIIVSDIMMPQMDGLELLRTIREDLRSSHIPFLVLTARGDVDTRLEGLALAADDVLVKPFNPDELQLRMKNIVRARSALQRRLSRRRVAAGDDRRISSPSPPDLSARDRQFLARLENWLEQHYTEPDASIALMAADLAMDPRTLQRKLKALTGETPGSRLQGYRIEQACRLLADSERAVGDIALSCGFSSLQYFSRVFSRVMGENPTSWRSNRAD
jgi:signal transduction histidine kinase/DNA-binding response OmpR family regulator/streptogramin lyase